MLTGRLPIGHGVRDNAGFLLDPEEMTFAEDFKGLRVMQQAHLFHRSCWIHAGD